jgi:hypothetical protein
MRGISSNWKRQSNEKEKQPYRMKEPHLMSELLKCDADGQELSPVYNREAGRISSSGSWEPDVLTDERVIEQDEEDRVFAMVEGDHHAKKVLHGLLDGLKKKDIMSQLDLSEKQYAAVVKRILRLLGPLNGGSKGIATCPHVNLDRPVNSPDGPPMPSEHRAAIDEAYTLKDCDLLLRHMASPNPSTSGYANQMYDALKVERGGEKDDR